MAAVAGQNLVEIGQGIREPQEIPVRGAAIGQSFQVTRTQDKRAVISLDGVFVPVHVLQDIAAVVPALCVGAVQRQRPVARGQGLIQPAQPAQHMRAGIVALHMPRILSQRLIIAGQRVIQPSQPLQRIAPVVPGLRQRGIDGDGRI